jgi:4-hydroxybenzoate polyprenyltransferase
MIEHTLFSLPLAVAAFLAESGGRPGWRASALILVAVFGARNAANALNRLIDVDIDAANPRTAGRDLVAGRVKAGQLAAFAAVGGLLFLAAAALLNPLCLALVPVGAAMIAGYSFTKRFTWLCHWWLGATCAAAVMGSFLALSGRFELRYFPLTVAAAAWVAGFDVIYALQDLEHDRAHGLHSAPARWGRVGALLLSGASHLGALAAFALHGVMYAAGPWYWAGLAAVAAILAAEQAIAWRGDQAKLPLAAYTLNQILSPLFLVFAALDVYWPGGRYGF